MEKEGIRRKSSPWHDVTNAKTAIGNQYQVIDEIELGISRFQYKLNKEQTILFYYRISYIYFGSGLHKEALKWVNKILNDNEQILRQDIYSFARIFNLILHYELNNYDLLDYIIKSTSRYLSKTEKNYRSEQVFIKYLKSLSKIQNEKEKNIRKIYNKKYKLYKNGTI